LPTRWRGPDRARFRRRAALALALVGGAWLAAGVRPVGTDSFGVLSGPLLAGRAVRVDGWVLAPPGLLRLERYPRRGVELPLPQAAEAMLPAADGSRYGFRGWVTLRPRPDAWRELHDASGGDGLEGALVDAVRAAAAGLGPGAERSGDGPGLARRLERGLTAALAERGIDLRRLELDAVDFLAAGPGAAVTDTRLLVIGLDGLDWEILDPLLEAGRLPNLARLIENGVRAKLLTISPMLSPVI